jgi:hypothetical protein
VYNIVDQFSGMLEIATVSNHTAKEAARVLTNYICRYGPVRFVTSDRGRDFTAVALGRMVNILGAEHRLVAIRNHRAVGTVERIHRWLNVAVAELVHAKATPAQIKQQLPLIALYYNTTVHAIHGFSPYAVFFGREPLEILDPRLDDSPPPQSVAQADWLTARHHLMSRLHAVTKALRTDSDRKVMADSSKNRRPALRFAVDEHVLMADDANPDTGKLSPPYQAGWIVHEILPNDSYMLKYDVTDQRNQRRVHQVLRHVHANRIAKDKSNGAQPPTPFPLRLEGRTRAAGPSGERDAHVLFSNGETKTIPWDQVPDTLRANQAPAMPAVAARSGPTRPRVQPNRLTYRRPPRK